MKKLVNILIVASFMLALLPVAASPANLLDNPDAEDGVMDPWVYTGPVEAAMSRHESCGTVVPMNGSYFFNMAKEPGSYAQMWQEVSVTGGWNFSAGGYIQTELWPDCGNTGITENDYGKLTVTFLDSGSSPVGTFSTGPIGYPTCPELCSIPLGYDQFSVDGTIPTDAVTARYELEGFLIQGTWVNVFYDDLYFEMTPPPVAPEWIVYNTDNSGLPHNSVYALAIDEQGNLWIGTYGGGVANFDGETWTVYDTANSGLPHNYVRSLAIDEQGNLWIGTEGGGLANFDGETWTVYDTANSGLPSNYVKCLAFDAPGNLWIGTWAGGLANFDGENWTVYDTANSGLPHNYVEGLAFDAPGNEWIGTEGGGLANFDGENWTVYDTANSGLPSNYVWCFAFDAPGNIWIGTRRGLGKFDGKNWTVYNLGNSGLPSSFVECLAIDEQGNKWIGTVGGGLAKFDGENWTVYDTANSGLPDEQIMALAIDEQGNLWIGTAGGGLAVYREGGVILTGVQK